MAKFPIERAKRLPPAVGPSVRAAIDVRTGGRAIGQAIAGLGKVIQDIADKYDIAQAETQLSEFQRESKRRINQLSLSFEGNLDPETYQDEYKKTLGEIRSLMPKNKRAAEGANLWLNNRMPSWELGVEESKLARANDNWLAELFEKQAEAKLTGKVGDFPAYLAAGVAEGRIDKSKAVRMLSETRREAAIREIWNKATIVVRPEDGEVNWAAAVKWFSVKENIKDIDPKIVSSLSGIAAAQANAQQVRTNIKQQKIDDEWTGKFSARLRFFLEPDQGETPAFSEIDASPMSEAAKEKMRTRVRVFDNYSEGELEEAFQDKGAVLADIYERVEANTITDEQIRDTVGKGLSPNTAESIIKDREIWRQHWYKETEQLFKRIFGWSPELGFGDDNFAAFLYEKVLREWQEQTKEQESKGEEIIELGRTIVRPYFIERLKKIMPYDEDIPRMVELALGEPEEVEKIEKEEIVPKAEEEPEPYTVGETRTDASGQLWEYIGDNKWRKR